MSDTATRSTKRTVARRVALAAVPVAAGAMLLPTLAQAATTSGQLTGCLKKTTGVMSLVKAGTSPLKKCPSGTVKVSWNVKGVTGAKGATGAQGPKGDKGDAGIQGIQGVAGLLGAQGLQGLTGPQGPAGEAGGLAGYQVVQKTMGLGDLSGLLGGLLTGYTVDVACPTGKMALSGGAVGGLLPGLSLLNSVVGGVPVLGGAGWGTVTSALPILGDTFYAVCVTATSALP